MTHSEALEFIRPLAIQVGEVWADLGAGSGTFSLALAERLGAEGTLHAVDINLRALRTIKQKDADARIVLHHKDFRDALGFQNLDGILLANALHFVREQERILAQLMLSIKTGGTLAIIEYNNSSANPWVPYPVNFARLERLASKLSLPMPKKLATHPSRYHQEMYLAILTIPELYA